MAIKKLRVVRVSLITLQLISLTIASVIIVVHYNPWIERMIDEAERSGNTSQSLADQIGRIEGEEIVIFLMSSATIIVSLIGVVGTLRGHSHCLLNFYMSTLIIFLFVIFVALCGTAWEVIWKLQYGQQQQQQQIHHHHHHHLNPPHSNRDQSSFGGDDNRRSHHIAANTSAEHENRSMLYNTNIRLSSSNSNNENDDNDEDVDEATTRTTTTTTTTTATTNTNTNTITGPVAAIPIVSWWYIVKSLICISLSAALYATSLRLTRRILESSDDRYLSASDDGDDEDDLNSEASSNGGGGGGGGGRGGGVGGHFGPLSRHMPYSNHSFNFHHNIAGAYACPIMPKSDGGGAGGGAGAAGGATRSAGPRSARPSAVPSITGSTDSSVGSPFRNV